MTKIETAEAVEAGEIVVEEVPAYAFARLQGCGD